MFNSLCTYLCVFKVANWIWAPSHFLKMIRYREKLTKYNFDSNQTCAILILILMPILMLLINFSVRMITIATARMASRVPTAKLIGTSVGQTLAKMEALASIKWLISTVLVHRVSEVKNNSSQGWHNQPNIRGAHMGKKYHWFTLMLNYNDPS